ncbi:MAG: VCBS repeat-containing protein [Candidatus Delongbacteria bacterium]|nr:VCBS repeat-containing protein [Candidatus Delongbacteria bacterium]
MLKTVTRLLLTILISSLLSEVITFNINDYTIDLKNHKIEHIDESSIYKHIYKDSLRLSITTDLLEFSSGKIPLYVLVDSIETVFVNNIIESNDPIENERAENPKYSNEPIKLGGRGILRHKYLAVLETFPFIFKEDSLFFIPRLEYSYQDSFVIPSKEYPISEEIDMIIITTESFKEAFEPYRIFKNKMGLTTKVKTIEDIYKQFQGENNVIKIRNFIKDTYNKNNIKYVILGGNYDVIPVGFGHPIDEKGSVPTDTFYSNLDGELDLNQNGVYLEQEDFIDFYSDVSVGRVPGMNINEIEAIIKKDIDYFTGNIEQRLGFNTSSFLSGFNVFYDRDGEKWCEIVKDEFPSYFNVSTFYEENSLEFNQQTLLNALNLGYNIFYHQSHGDYNKIGQNENKWALWSDHFYNLNGISGLYFISSCHPGDISYSGLSQKAMINPSGGCINYIGSSAEEYPAASINMHSVFFNHIFKGKDMGESITLSNLLIYGDLNRNPVGRYQVQCYNIQGDPSNKLFLREPRNIGILGINQFKKGSGYVNGIFNMVPIEPVEITLIADGEIISKTTTSNQSFRLDYENLFTDSVYVYYHSQECYLKEKGYKVYDNNDTEIEITNLGIDDDNNTDICESGDHFALNFDVNVSLNELNHDSLIVYLSQNNDENFNFINDSMKIAIPALNDLTNISVFDIVYDPLTKAKPDSSLKVKLNFQIDGGSLLLQKDIYIPYSDPVLKLQSVSFTGNNILPTFINDSQGLINKVQISLLEIIKEDETSIKGTKTLYNVSGLSVVKNDTLVFAADSTKIYKFEIVINDEYTYDTSDFKAYTSGSGNITLNTDYSPGRVNLQWTHDLSGDFKYNVYIDTDINFTDPVLKNFESLNTSSYTFYDDQVSNLYVQVALLDTNNVEFIYSPVKEINFIPLYTGKEFKINQYEMYNPMFVDNKLIANLINSSVSGINKDGSLINGTGIIHESEVQGFSTALQQGYAIGDVNGDGANNIVNYLRNVGDSVQVKVVDLTTGNKIASKKVYGYFMETTPVLVQYDEDPELEIMISCFNGNIAGDPKGAYFYMLDYVNGTLEMVSGFPLISAYGQYYTHTPSLIDLDNNGIKEIIADCYNKIEIYSSSDLSHITTYGLSTGIQTALSYCDIDDDGQIEVFAISESMGNTGKLFGYRFDGSTLGEILSISGGISISMKSSAFSDLLPPVSFPDIDGDLTPDIVALTSSKLYIYDNQFNSRNNFPIDLDSRIETNNSSAPSFGDLDGDTVLDVLFMDANFRIWCYSGSSGSLIKGFPIQVEDIGRTEMTALPIMDLDGDNDLEFAVGTNNGVMLVYDYPTNTTRIDTYDKFRGDQYNSGLFSVVLGVPGNISTVQSGNDLVIYWDQVATATSYKIFISDDPYSGFVLLDETSDENYTVYNITDTKKFYYVIAIKY